MKRLSRTLKEEADDQANNHPLKTNEIYATIRIPEIVQGLTAEDFKQMDKDKAQYQKMIMD